LGLPKRKTVTRGTDLDDEKKAPVRDRNVRVLNPKGNETAKSTSYGSESEPVGKAQTQLVLRVE
jgi:hypothetical protein